MLSNSKHREFVTPEERKSSARNPLLYPFRPTQLKTVAGKKGTWAHVGGTAVGVAADRQEPAGRSYGFVSGS